MLKVQEHCMTYVEARKVLENPHGKIARQKWNGQMFVYMAGPDTHLFQTGGKDRRWHGHLDERHEDDATDWMDVTEAMHWNAARDKLRSGAWKAALRMSWYQPFFITRTQTPATYTDEHIQQIKDSHDSDIAREFVTIGVINSRLAPFENMSWDLIALDWVEATPDNMRHLMPKGLDWQSALNYLKAKKFPVRWHSWHPTIYLRQEDGKLCLYQTQGAGPKCIDTNWAIPLPGTTFSTNDWEILPPDWFVAEYGPQPSNWDKAVLALKAGLKARRVAWDVSAPNAYLYMKGTTIWARLENGNRTVYGGASNEWQDWRIMPVGWDPDAKAPAPEVTTKPSEEFSITVPDIDTDLIFTLAGAMHTARRLIAAGRKNVLMRRIAWGFDQHVAFKEVRSADSITAPPVTKAFFWSADGDGMPVWMPTYSDHLAEDWQVCREDQTWGGAPEPTDFDFSGALHLMQARGLIVSRRSWIHDVKLRLCKPRVEAPYFQRFDGKGWLAEWLPTHEDLLAGDWYEVK